MRCSTEKKSGNNKKRCKRSGSIVFLGLKERAREFENRALMKTNWRRKENTVLEKLA